MKRKLVAIGRWLKRRKWILLGGVGVGVPVVLALLARGQAQPVEIGKVRRGDVIETIKAMGKIEAGEQVVVKAPISGRVKRVFVQDGEQVERGGLLVEMDSEGLQDAVKQKEIAYYQAQANVERLSRQRGESKNTAAKNQLKEAKMAFDEAKRGLEDAQFLYKNGAIAQEELEKAKAAYERAKLGVETAKANFRSMRQSVSSSEIQAAKEQMQQAKRAYEGAQQASEQHEVYAERAGIVQFPGSLLGSGSVKEGMLVQKGQALFALLDTQNLKVTGMLDVYDAEKVKVGQNVKLTSETTEKSYRGFVSKLQAQVVQRENLSGVAFEVEFHGEVNERLGTTMRIEIITSFKQNVLLVPKEALQGNVVYTVKHNSPPKALLKSVVVGASSGSFVEVKGGLQEGDWVILKPLNLKNGQRVKVKD